MSPSSIGPVAVAGLVAWRSARAILELIIGTASLVREKRDSPAVRRTVQGLSCLSEDGRACILVGVL
jgi:hypothetical protein